jgi:hypothetical protein
LAWREQQLNSRATKTHSWFTRAVAYLDAVEISPGRYAYRDGATRRYYVVTGSQLERLGRYIEAQIKQRATSGKLPFAGGFAQWGADTIPFDMPAWWTPAVGLDAFAAYPWRGDQIAKREKAENLMRWVNERWDEPTTVLVARLKLPRDYHHCVLVDSIRYDGRESARKAALTLAQEVADTFAFDGVDEQKA